MSLKIVHSTITDRERQVKELSQILVAKWRAKAKKSTTNKPKPKGAA